MVGSLHPSASGSRSKCRGAPFFCSVFPRFLKKNKTDRSLRFPGFFKRFYQHCLSHGEEPEERAWAASETAALIDVYVELLCLEAVDRVVVEYFGVSVGCGVGAAAAAAARAAAARAAAAAAVARAAAAATGTFAGLGDDEERREQLQRLLVRQQR